ncbi:MAG: malto-oligosyltrehalose synthase [Actinomycetota bacterium]
MRIPCATYRLQLNQNFNFTDALNTAGYLSDLGIDTIYGSPVFESAGTGYDITDPLKISSSLGGYKKLKELSAGLKKLDMLYLQDIVPNHMAYRQENPLIADLFKKGKKSAFRRYFDINWNHHSRTLKGKVLAPFLGKTHQQAFRKGEIKLCFGPGGFKLKYRHLSYPLSLETYPYILGEDMPAPIAPNTGPGKLYRLYEKNSRLKEFIDKRIRKINKNQHMYFGLADKQAFRLAYWKVANEQINYRRFFTINNLICTSTQRKEVFEYIHKTVKKMAEEGIIDGVRVDHIDGLQNPRQYLKKLKALLGTPFIIVEKILADGEELPDRWPVWGTTGYDYLNQLNGLFSKTSNRSKFDRIYHNFTGQQFDFGQMVYEKKKLILEKHMQGDVDNLAHTLAAASKETTIAGLQKAISAVLSSFPVYRTYTDRKPSPRDLKYIKSAIREALKREPDLENELKLLREVLCGSSHRKFRMQFQQYSGPVAAKGFEDTLLYNYNRLLSLNEVGSNPARFGTRLDKFYSFCKKRARNWPYSLNATSTHDTKRGEDARARINVLSEIPELWQEKLLEWKEINRPKKKAGCPDANDEYFLYQAMLGSYTGSAPSFEHRMEKYIIKAIREAKVHTAWIRPDAGYEEGFVCFFKDLLADSNFMQDFAGFVQMISFWQSFSSLSQALVKITSPGIPDFYQGTELWDYSLVDPDNRREVDYKKRAQLLSRIKDGNGDEFLKNILQNTGNGMAKLFLIHRALEARKMYMDIFLKGDFVPVDVSGKFKGNIIAFSRVLEKKWMVTVAPRFFSQLIRSGLPLGTAVFKDTKIHLPFGNMRNLITGKECGSLLIGELLSDFPAALLWGKEA